MSLEYTGNRLAVTCEEKNDEAEELRGEKGFKGMYPLAHLQLVLCVLPIQIKILNI